MGGTKLGIVAGSIPEAIGGLVYPGGGTVVSTLASETASGVSAGSFSALGELLGDGVCVGVS